MSDITELDIAGDQIIVNAAYAMIGSNVAGVSRNVSALQNSGIFGPLATNLCKYDCKSGDPDSSDSRSERGEKGEISKGFSERGQTYVIRGAIVLITIGGVLAYLTVNRET